MESYAAVDAKTIQQTYRIKYTLTLCATLLIDDFPIFTYITNSEILSLQ